MGTVERVFVAGGGGQPMRPVDEVQAVAGRGLDGDRYATRRGYWTDVDECQVTLIAGERWPPAGAGSASGWSRAASCGRATRSSCSPSTTAWSRSAPARSTGPRTAERAAGKAGPSGRRPVDLTSI